MWFCWPIGRRERLRLWGAITQRARDRRVIGEGEGCGCRRWLVNKGQRAKHRLIDCSRSGILVTYFRRRWLPSLHQRTIQNFKLVLRLKSGRIFLTPFHKTIYILYCIPENHYTCIGNLMFLQREWEMLCLDICFAIRSTEVDSKVFKTYTFWKSQIICLSFLVNW